jgi:hypothetical protein
MKVPTVLAEGSPLVVMSVAVPGTTTNEPEEFRVLITPVDVISHTLDADPTTIFLGVPLPPALVSAIHVPVALSK